MDNRKNTIFSKNSQPLKEINSIDSLSSTPKELLEMSNKSPTNDEIKTPKNRQKGQTRTPIENSVKNFPKIFFNGIMDGLLIFYAMKLIYYSSRVRKIMLPALRLSGIYLLANIYFHVIIGIETTAATTQFLYLFWMFPVYTLVSVFNYKYHTGVLELIYKQKYKEKNYQKQFEFSTKTITEIVYGNLLMIGMLLEIQVVKRMFPSIVVFILHCWLFSFYIFEFKLLYLGYDIKTRIDYFQRRWVYFLGYGMPLTVAYFALPTTLSMSFHLFIINFLIINTINLHPKKHYIHSKFNTFPIFKFPQMFANLIVGAWMHFFTRENE